MRLGDLGRSLSIETLDIATKSCSRKFTIVSTPKREFFRSQKLLACSTYQLQAP
ncbi:MULTISPECIES: hypothetical protein [Trichocoleus]|uniref:Uncharacterized protein n=1 Tax=Trichocoleus desertorum GB2-A4 TaxID=2933944 RepID=A0ABV0J7T1_9CYAN|nr:hypothetical protein [Trichocoleus sp. FACHB-46]